MKLTADLVKAIYERQTVNPAKQTRTYQPLYHKVKRSLIGEFELNCEKMQSDFTNVKENSRMKTDTSKARSLTEFIGRVAKLFGWRLIVGLLIAAGFLLFFGWLAEEVFEGETKIFDEAVRNFVHGFAAPPLTALMKFFSFLGSPLFLVILGVVVVAVFLYLKYKRAVALFLITMLGEIALDPALKTYFGRARPAAFFDYPIPLSFSFPSGHAFGSLCFYGILAWLIIARTANKKIRMAIAAAAFTLIFFIGLSRIYLGVHYPSDVLAGYAAGSFWVGVVALTDARLRRKNIV